MRIETTGFGVLYPRSGINDDDLYVVEFQGKHGWYVVQHYPASSAIAASAHAAGLNVKPSQALFRGMALKGVPQ